VSLNPSSAPRSHEIDARGVRIALDDRGSGPPVVLGHSFLCSRQMWSHQVDPLAAQHRVINLDLRGHGASDRIRSPFSLDDMVSDVVAVLDHLRIDRAVWAGLSVGGMVALRAALRVPDRVTGLILVDTDGGTETTWRRVQYSLLGAVARTMGMRPVLPIVARRMFGVTTLRTRPDLVDQWRERFAAMHIPSALAMLAAVMSRENILSRLQAVEVPALVLVGSEDTSLPPRRARRLADALPRATYLEVPEAGHLSALEQPQRVTAAMLDFLRSLPTAQPRL
jgi:3-oxoadipate enol-lactonase